MHACVQHPPQHRPSGAFAHAVNTLAQRLGGAPASKPTPISIFKAHYGGILKAADSGTVQVISQGDKRYVLLTEQQLVEAMAAGEGGAVRSLAGTLDSLTPPKVRLDPGLVMLAGSARDLFGLPEGTG